MMDIVDNLIERS